LALLLLWAGGQVGPGAEVAGFAAEWADDRSDRAERAAARAGAPKAATDPKTQAARRVSRERSVDAGLDDLDLMLADVIRQGLSAARTLPYAFWDSAARRLVDARAPAIATHVRELASTIAAGDADRAAAGGGEWAGRALSEIGRLHLAVEAWRRRDDLPAATRADLEVFVGLPVAAEVVRQGPPIRDAWLVLGVREDGEARLRSQRTWLRGLRTRSFVLLLEFAAGGQPMPMPNVVGSLVHAEFVAYPGSPPCRVLVNGGISPEADLDVALAASADTADPLSRGLERIGAWRAANPFAGPLPLHAGDVQILRRPGTGGPWDLLIVDEAGVLPARSDADVDQVLARTGGQPTMIVGEHLSADGRPGASPAAAATAPASPRRAGMPTFSSTPRTRWGRGSCGRPGCFGRRASTRLRPR